MAERNIKPGYLEPLTGEAKPKEVIAFDCETWGKKNRFVVGTISYQHETIVHTDPHAMLEELGGYENRNKLTYATNLHFDAFTLFNEVAGAHSIPEGWEAFDNGSKLIFCKRRVNDKWIYLLDSLNLFPLGVYDLGTILGKVAKSYARLQSGMQNYYAAGKLEAPSIMGKKPREKLSSQELEALITYCKADAEVTRKFMEWSTREIVSLGAKVKLTAASTAMDLYRRRFLPSTIPQPSWESMIDARHSYYGGRTEDYLKGNVGAGFENDITAMYPSVMEESLFPMTDPQGMMKDSAPTDHCLEDEGFTKLTLTSPTDKDSPEYQYPALPHRGKDHLLFPVGKLTGVWTNPQIRYAISLGWEPEKIEWSYHTDRTFRPFEDYVKNLMNLRLKYLCPGCEASDLTGIPCWQAGRKCVNAHATEEVIKLFLNGLYGKFAQNFLTEEEGSEAKLLVKKGGGSFKPMAEASPEELSYTMEHHPEYLEKGVCLSTNPPSLKPFMNPILASYVTSGAQCKINEHQVKATKHGVRVFYTDTDSLLTNKRLPWAVKGKELGKLQEASEFEELIIVGPKAKLVKEKDGKQKATYKGVPGKSWIVENEDTMDSRSVQPRKDIFAGMVGDQLKVNYTRMAKAREAIHLGFSPNEMLQVTKEFQPFTNPKRKIIGKPSIKDLLTKSFESTPWEVK